MRERLRLPCFFCTSRLQTKPTLSNSNIAYSWMSWCTKFHCIISKKRYLIVYGNHIRPKRSRLRRCDPAVQLLTHGYTDTAKAANQRRQNGPSAKLQYVLRQIPILHQLITQAYESSAAANAQKVFEGWLCECRTASSIASQNWIILLTHTHK